MLFVDGFPTAFWFTGVIDGVLTTLYVVFALQGGLKMADLFLPETQMKKHLKAIYD